MKVPFNDLQRGVIAIQAQLEAAALNVLRSGWFVLGQSVQRFEAAFASYCGAQHCRHQQGSDLAWQRLFNGHAQTAVDVTPLSQTCRQRGYGENMRRVRAPDERRLRSL